MKSPALQHQAVNTNAFSPRWKAWSLSLFLFAFLGILYRLIQIQLIESDQYRDKLERQAYRTIPVYAARGNIVDRHQQLLARTVLRLTIAVDPALLQSAQSLVHHLQQLTGVPADTFYAKIRRFANRRFVVLARGLPLSSDSLFARLADPGVIRIKTPVRFYPFGRLAVQTIGFVNLQGQGQSGIERQYDSLLRGQDGYQTYLRDALGRLIPDPSGDNRPARNGHSLILTLDHRIQQIVEQELYDGIKRSEASAGTAIVMDPRSGEILAMASYPTFNPNQLATFSAAAAKNRAIADIYEPGSTFKAITAAALLEEGKIAPDDSVDGRGGQLAIDNHIIRDAHPLRKTDFRSALIYSSNVIFADIVRRLPAPTFYRYVRDFGFGLPTGIDLPAEARGIVKKPEQFDATTQMFMAFGYELAATALQILNAYAAIANGGQLMQPHLVQAIVDADGNIIRQFQPQPIRQIISKETADTLTHLLEAVVERGTGRNAYIAGVRIAGKTGTAQQLIEGKYSRQAHTTSFVGFFPADTPKIAMIVMLNRPRRGYYASQVAAPIFRRITQKLIPLVLRQPVSLQYLDSATINLPPLYGLDKRQLHTIARLYGFKVDTEGPTTGFVIHQTPPPGTRLQPGQWVTLRFSSALPPDSLHRVIRQLNWKGLTLRQAMNLVQLIGAIPKISGTGTVTAIRWYRRQGTLYCTIIAHP